MPTLTVTLLTDLSVVHRLVAFLLNPQACLNIAQVNRPDIANVYLHKPTVALVLLN